MIGIDAGGTVLKNTRSKFGDGLSRLRDIFSRRVITVLAVIFIIFLTSGGVYLIVMQPGAIASSSSGGTSFMSRGTTTSQTSTESLVAFFVTVAGVAGFVLLEGALRKSFDLHASRMKYLMALVLIVLSIGLMEFLFYAKLH
ncbi:MAG: hypothetical protein LUQ46_00145 [Candidatus Methanomethyliaceae archaeon]|nr:hypothetical protein [Candidatus Methanomethyliaceae archaeon]